MRWYALDDLVDPVRQGTLRVADAERVARPGPPVERCRRWCGYLGADPSAARPEDCAACAEQWVESGALVAGDRRYPIRDGIPRLRPEDAEAGAAVTPKDRSVRDSFAFEWGRFSGMLPDYDAEARDYFRLVPERTFDGATVLDAGCGMGRWAHHVARRPVRRVWALDYSTAVEQAQRTVAEDAAVHCVQADLRNLPFRPGTFDLVYSLGVLHHLPDPDAGVRSLAAALRGTGGLLLYLYYALENRPRHYRAIFRLVNAARAVTSRMPKRAVYALAWLIALVVYWPLARLARVLEAAGRRRAMTWVPLHHYRRRSLRMMVVDAFDRFATPLERRFTRDEIRAWLEQHGFRTEFLDTTPFWVVYGIRP